MQTHKIIGAFCLTVALASSPLASAIAEEPNGRIEATLRFSGAVPSTPDVHAPPPCGVTIHDESYVVGADHGIANGVAYLSGVKAPGAVPPRDLKISQHGCRFLPHVQVATVGSKLTVSNEDGTLHTAHGLRDAQTLFNVATPPGAGASPPQLLGRAGPIHIGCDVGHTWMSAWIYVFDHPYFGISGADGKLTIGDVPPGEYTLKAWHEKAGERAVKVTVLPGKTTNVTIDFSGQSIRSASAASPSAKGER
jgi:hypothetical protein